MNKTYYTQNINKAYELLKDEEILKWNTFRFRIGPDFKSVLVYDTIEERGINITEDYFKEFYEGITFECDAS